MISASRVRSTFEHGLKWARRHDCWDDEEFGMVYRIQIDSRYELLLREWAALERQLWGELSCSTEKFLDQAHQKLHGRATHVCLCEFGVELTRELLDEYAWLQRVHCNPIDLE